MRSDNEKKYERKMVRIDYPNRSSDEECSRIFEEACDKYSDYRLVAVIRWESPNQGSYRLYFEKEL